MKHLKGHKGCSTKKVTLLTAQMKCLYMNAHNVGNKEGGLEATMLLESCDLIVITETWWDKSCDYVVATDGYRVFRRDREGWRGRGIALYIKKSIQCEELSLNSSHEQVECLWVRIRDRGNKSNLVVGVYYRLPDQGEPSSSCSRRLHAHSLFSYWEMSNTLKSTGRAAQRAVGNPGDS